MSDTQLHRAHNAGALLELLHLPLDGRGQPEIIEDARPEIRGDATNGRDRVVDQRRHGGQFRAQGGDRVGHPHANPRRIHLQRGQGLPEHVVNLPGNRGPFLLSRHEQAAGQALQLLPRFRHRLLRLFSFRHVPPFGNQQHNARAVVAHRLQGEIHEAQPAVAGSMRSFEADDLARGCGRHACRTRS